MVDLLNRLWSPLYCHSPRGFRPIIFYMKYTKLIYWPLNIIILFRKDDLSILPRSSYAMTYGLHRLKFQAYSHTVSGFACRRSIFHRLVLCAFKIFFHSDKQYVHSSFICRRFCRVTLLLSFLVRYNNCKLILRFGIYPWRVHMDGPSRVHFWYCSSHLHRELKT